MSIAYNPNQNLYYGASGGFPSAAMETFDTNGVQLSSTSQGMD